VAAQLVASRAVLSSTELVICRLYGKRSSQRALRSVICEESNVCHIKFLRTMLDKRMPPSGMSRRVALVGTEVLEDSSASMIGLTRIGELETTLTVAVLFCAACVGS
jgi:hypothetical protein